MRAIFRLLLLMLFSQIVWAQTPGIPYQAVIMDKESGQELPGLDNSYANPLRNSLVSIRFSIHDINGMEFEETHHSVIVDDYGMINLIVGKGVYTYMDFYNDMDWNGEEKWLKVQIDFENGNDFENLDYLPIHRIPNPDDQKLSLSGDSLILEDGGGVSLTDLLSGAGVDEQQISLVGNVIYLENGGSIDLTDLPLGAIDIINFAEDSVVTINADGDLRQVSALNLVKEPWFGVDDSSYADLNTEDIFHTGKVGIATKDPKAELHVLGDLRVDGASILSYDTTVSILHSNSGTWTNVLHTDGYTNLGLLSVTWGGAQISGNPVVTYESGANTTTKGIVERGNNLIGDIRESFWVYVVNGGWLKAARLDFRTDGDTVQCTYLNARYRAIVPVTEARQTPSWFETTEWNGHNYDFSEIKIEYDSVSAGNTTIYISDSSYVGIGLPYNATTNPEPTQRLDVRGSVRIDEFIYDENNENGTSGQFLSRTSTGIDWSDLTSVDFSGLPTYADDAAAAAGGLAAGRLYKTATGEIRIKL